MPIQIIRDPKTGEERRVFVSPGGMGDGAAPKPKPQPAGGGFMGTLNDFNPAKQLTALGTGVSTFMQTGDLNKSIAAASKEAAPTTDLGRSIDRGAAAGIQKAADSARYEIDRQEKARAKYAQRSTASQLLGDPSGKGFGSAADLPSTGPGAPSAQSVKVPGWANYDNLRIEPENLVEQGLAGIVEFLPYFVTGNAFTAPLMGAARTLPVIGKAATRFEKFTGGLRATQFGPSQAGLAGVGEKLAGAGRKVAGVALEEAVSGAPASAFATYYTTQPGEGTTSDALMEKVKGTPWEPIVAKGLLTNRNDTVDQARLKAAIDDLIWSIPLGGTVGTGFRGVGAMREPTKRVLSNWAHKSIQFVQAKAAAKNAAEAPPAAAAEPGVPSAGTPAAAPAPKVVSGKQGFSSETYQAMRRTPMWEKTGVEIQGRLEPQAGQPVPAEMRMPADSYYSRLNYSDINPDAGPLNASGKRYAEALSTQDADAIYRTQQKLRASFKDTAERLGIELGPNAASQSWSMWDIGKQLYMDANPTKSNKPYVLGNPLTNIQVQADIVDRMLGFEMTKGVDVEGKRLKSWQLTAIGRKAREDAGIDLNLAPDPEAQRTVPAPAAPATPLDAAAQLQQAEAEFITASQRLQSEAAKEQVTVADPWFAPEGQLPGMNPPAYEQVATIETNLVAAAPKTFQYKAEGQTATGRSGSLAEENVYDPRYGGVISVWRDTQGELGAPGQIYVVNGHNRLELANRSGFPVINVQYIDAPTAAQARMTGALQNIKDDKGTAIDAAKIFRDTGMSVEDLRLQNVNLNGKLASEGVALSRLPQWLFDKTAVGDLPTAKSVALGSADGIDEAIISDVAKQAIAGKWSAEKIVQAMQEAKFASAGAAPAEGVLPGFEEMFKTTNVVDLIDIRTAAYRQLSVEMRALAAASQTKNTSYLEAAGNAINVEGSQAARKMAAEAVAVFNRVTAYEGPVRTILNELAAQMPTGKGRDKAATNLVQFNLQRLRDAISEEMNGPRLIQDEAVARQIEEPPAAAAVEAPATGYADPLEAENLADARTYLGLPATANVAQVARVAKQSGYDGIVFTGDFGLPGGKKEIDLRALPEVKAPENTGNPAPIQAKPVDVAPVVDNETISTALERQALAQEAGDTQLAGELGAWLGRRNVSVADVLEQSMAAAAASDAAIYRKAGESIGAMRQGLGELEGLNLPRELAGLKPRYSYGSQKRYELAFETDLDKVAYTLAGDATGKPSKSHQKYRDWLESNGLDPAEVAEYGARVVKPSIKEMAASSTATSGTLQVRNQGFGGASFSAELPNLKGWQSVEGGAGGTIGEGYTGANRITEREASELARIAFQITGVTDFDIQKRIEVTYGEKQAREYGDMSLVGKKAEIAGSYKHGKRMADDTITVAMSAYGRNLSFTRMLSTTYHESMHRLMQWFFTSAENLVLSRSEKSLREMAALTAESFGQTGKAAKYRDGTITMHEVVPDAFAAFMRGITLPKVDLQGFAKLKNYIDQSINFLLSGGKYKTWDDVFEKAALGEFKPAGGRDGGGGVSFAADPPDPAEFARRIEQNMEALASGDLSPEEIARMGASDVRRLTSRSGNTQYVPDPPDTLVASNKALAEMLASRGQATDISDASMTAINTAAFDQLYRDGWTVDSTVARLEAARRGDPRSQEDLIALAANLIHRDDLAAQNALTAIEWQSAVDEVDRAAAMQRLWAGLESQHKLDTSLMTASRKDGQRLRVMQLRYDFDPTHRQVPTGTPLYHGNTEAAAQSIIDNGFQASGPKSNLLGSGVYFSETSVSAGVYGETAVAGDLPGDVRILDLVTMDKRIADLVQELNLGPLQRRGESLYTTPAQNRAIQDWAVGQGYSGIRFSPDFELGSGAAPETVIYDVGVANRVVGSNAAVEAEIPVTNERMGTDIEDEILNPINTILGKIDPDIRNAIADGVMTPEANDITDAVAQAVISSRHVPGMAAKLNSIVGKADVGRLNQEMFLQAYRAALLWSPKTWTKMLVGSAYRAVTMPANQALGELAVAGAAALKGDNKAKAAALRQARIDMAMYGQIVANWSNAWRLVGESFRTGESFGNLGASSMDIAQRNLRGSNRDQMALMAETDEPANTLDNPWWYDPENANIPAHAAKYAWTLLNASGRIAGSLDTFYSSLIGPSAEWGRIIGLELEKAEGRGLTGDEAWAEASKKADEAIENQWSDVILNERIIKNGAFTGIHAENAMNWVNFTDPLKIDFEERTYEYGIAKAKEEGLTDVAEINRRAMAWMQEEPNGFAKAGMGTGQFIGALPRLAKDAISHTPALGILNAFPTSPVNIAKSAARATGFLSPFVDSFTRDIYSQDRNTRARAIGEVAMGYLTLTAGVLLATSGWVEFSGPGSYDEKTREKMRRMGQQSYSMRLRNPMTGQTTRWWDLQALDSVSNIFALVGTFVQKSNSLAKEDREALGSNFILATIEMFREVGMAQATKDAYKSIGELFNLVSDLSEKGFIPVRGQIDPFSAYVEKRMAGYMPAIFNNVRKGVDPYQRAIEKSELPMPIAQAHELAQRYANKIPGLSRTLPPILHPLTAEPLLVEGVWGLNHLPQDQPWLLGLVNGLSPLAFTPTKQGTKDPVDTELGRLSGRGTMFQIWSQNEFNVPRYKLTQTQLNKLATITSELVPPGRNGTLHQELSAAVAPNSSYWQLDPPEPSKATTSQRAIRLNKAITYYKPFIKEAFLASEPELARILAENKAEQERNVIEEAQSSQSSWSPTPANR
jgi:hypothetical protein